MSQELYLHQARKSVAFIFLEKSNQEVQPLGTGFFVGIRMNSEGPAVYFVTAKHVLISKATGKYYEKVLLRLNTKSGSVEYIELDLSKHVILTHPDPKVDLAATILYPPQDKFDYLIVLDDYFTDARILAEKKIMEGSPAFFAGLLANFAYRKQRNYPVIRFGYISLLTDESIEIMTPFGSGGSNRFYLVECQSLGAFSGSPVFFERERITKEKVFFSPEIYLGGVMQGHFNDLEALLEKNLEQNTGLALVIPCYLLTELLHTEEAKKDREQTPSY